MDASAHTNSKFVVYLLTLDFFRDSTCLGDEAVTICVSWWRYDIFTQHSSVQRMARLDGLTQIPDHDRLFHCGFPEILPNAKPTRPTDTKLRRYKYPCTRFASARIRDMALTSLNLSKMADVAMSCLDDSQSSIGYWWEMLSLRFLQVKPRPPRPFGSVVRF